MSGDRKKDKIETRFNTKNISNRFPLEYTDDDFNNRPENDIIIKNLNSRLKLRNIKKSSIISYCEELDINNDGIIKYKIAKNRNWKDLLYNF